MAERVVVPLLGGRASLHVTAVEVRHHGGSADSEPSGEVHDRGAGAVVVDECIDINTAKSALRSMRCGRWGSPPNASGWLLAGRLNGGV